MAETPPPAADGWPEPARALLEQMPSPAALFDDQDRLRWANPAFRSSFGLQPGEQPLWPDIMRANHAAGRGTRIETADFERWLASVKSRRGLLPYRQFETDQVDGRWLMMTETLAPNGWMLCLAVDITDLGREHRDLRQDRDAARRASVTDTLTGLGNRGFVLARLERMLAWTGEPRPCVLMADLDHFKAINDNHGHAGGDQVLRDFAGLLQGHVRRNDACGRLGGEEFLVVLDAVPLATAQEVLARLQAAVRAARPLAERPDFGYTCSFGLAQARPGERPEDVLRRADGALYQAKQLGRDRWVLAEG